MTPRAIREILPYMKSTTPTFRVEANYVGGRFATTPEAWPTLHLGRPNDRTLAQWVEHTEASTGPEGVNKHLGQMVVKTARVVRQSTGEVVATYNRPEARA